jgi:adenine-specific DNA-methyltransferase
MSDKYLKSQIITYLGNKRKLLHHIEEIIKDLPHKIIGDGFSGSGIVSRLFKLYADELYTNDIAGYSETLNKCYLSTISSKQLKQIQTYIKKANEFADNPSDNIDKFVQLHWTNNRLYFTPENAKRIDAYRFFINKCPKNIQPFLLAQLIIKSSIHNNTNGQFSAFYKDNGVPTYGGKTKTDLNRITKQIRLDVPILNDRKCDVYITRDDVNKWVDKMPEMDIVYYDPPYNKHPYNIYYFLLDIINDWDLTIQIPDTYRGQPKNWLKSDYNSRKKAYDAFENLIKKTKAKYILISYNNGGIIKPDDMETMLKKYGELTIKPITHKTYNRLKGIASYKLQKEKDKIKEVIYILKTN